jgi:hypothetical protein
MKELVQFEDPNFWTFIKEMHRDKGGVYKIIAVRNGERIPINRFLGTDKDGVLYIGMGKSYKRISDLKKSISPNYKGSAHICGRRYKLNPNIALQFPYESLFIEPVYADDPREAEEKLIEAYRDRFGEVPPLNAI